MAIGRISGQMLKSNLLRSGTDLAFETNLLVLDVTNSFVGIGTATPARQLHIAGTGALRLPSGTDAERGTPANGDIRYNTDSGTIEGYSGGAWTSMVGEGLDNVVDDTTPQLGGNLDVNGQSIVTAAASDADINITPDGTGSVVMSKVDIAAGEIDGTTIGANSAAAGTFTAITGTSLTVGEGNITNVGDIALDSISADGTDINIAISDNSATALTVKEGANAYLTFDSTNSAEVITSAQDFTVATGKTFTTDTADINGGAIDGAIIGANSAAAGTFTDLTANGTIDIDDGVGTGTMDGVIIGSNTAAAGTFTTITTTGNATIGGDLIVNGTTTTIESSTLTIEDPLIQLAKNNSGGAANAFDQGLFFNRGSLDNVSFLWDESADEFVVAVTSGEDGTTAGNITIDSYANFRAGTVTADLTGNVTGNVTGNLTGNTQINGDLIFYNDAGSSTVGKIQNNNDRLEFFNANGLRMFYFFNTPLHNIQVERPLIIASNMYLSTNKIQQSIGIFGNIEIEAGSSGSVIIETGSNNEINVTNGLVDVTGNITVSGTISGDVTGNVTGNVLASDGSTVIVNSSTSAGTFTSVVTSSTITLNADSTALQVGADNDLQLTFNGTDSVITSVTGNLALDGNAGNRIIVNASSADVDFQVNGDTTVSLFRVDASAETVGIATQAPAYILDIGSSTDAVKLPNGDTATRPTASTGIIRFNTDTSKYEGSQDGSTFINFQMEGDTPTISKDTATGDGSTTTFTGFFGSAPAAANNVLVFIDNVYQEPTENYSVSGTNITFTSAPHSSARIFAISGFDNTAAATGGVARTQTASVSFESSATDIMSFNASTYRSAELFVTVTDSANTEYSAMKAVVIHDGTSAFITTYGITNTGAADTVTLTAEHDGSNTVSVKATSTGGSQTAKVQYSLQAV